MPEENKAPDTILEKEEEKVLPTGDESVEKKEADEAPEPDQKPEVPVKSPEEIARLQSMADKLVQDKRDNVDYWNKQAEMEKDPAKKLEAERKAFQADKDLFELSKDIPQAPSIDSEVTAFKAELGIEAGSEVDTILAKAKEQGPEDYKEIATYTMKLLRASAGKTKTETDTKVPVDISKGPEGDAPANEAFKRGDIFQGNKDTKQAAKASLLNTIKELANKGR